MSLTRLAFSTATFRGAQPRDIQNRILIYFGAMAKHLVDIDEKALIAAKSELGTRTLKDTVNEALRRVAPRRDRRMARALDTLARAKLADRSAAWR